jgi:FkbM family methyltransferase
MMYYTQYDEERIFLEYFGNHKGMLIDIGANDGETFSNSLRLIELGWSAHLVEPHHGAYSKCESKHEANDNVTVFPFAIGATTDDVIFYSGSDSLLSTTRFDNMAIFKDCKFDEMTCQQLEWAVFYELIGSPKIDFLSVDAEGMDWEILKQIDLTNISMVCFEKNTNTHHCMKHCLDSGLKKVHETYCNLIFAR